MLALGDLLFELERLSTQLPSENGLFQGVDYRMTLLNRGQKDFVRRTKFLRDHLEFTTIIGQREYDFKELFPQVMDMDHEGGVRYDGDLIKEKTLARKDRDDGAWRQVVSGTPKEYYFRDQRFFGFDFIPDDDLVTDFFALVAPTDMLDTTDEPFNGHHAYEDYYMAPVYFALKELLMKDDKAQKKYEGEYGKLLAMALKLPYQKDNLSTKRLRPLNYNSMRGRRMGGYY